MNRKFAKYFSHFQGVNLATFDEHIEKEVESTYNPLDEVLKEIFTVDPRSGLPRGDIQYFLSKDGNPQVKAWLETNLLQPRVANGMADPAKVSDDLIVEMSRRSDETTDSYAARIMGIYDEAQANLAALQAKSETKTE